MTENKENKFLITIGREYHKVKLDKFLADEYSASFSLVRKLARKGQIRLNSSRVKGNENLKEGDVVKIPGLFLHMQSNSEISNSSTEQLFTEKQIKDAKKMIIFEDEDILIINKPAGMPVQAGSGQEKSIDRLFAEVYPENPPKLVHRLDKDTSGCLAMTKNKAAAKTLAEQFSRRKAHKKYLTIVVGELQDPKGEVTFSIDKQYTSHNKEQMKVVVDNTGRSAKTFYNRVARNKQFHFLEVEIETGRTHQIRVHMQALGAPILGDNKYSEKALNILPNGKQAKMCLHSYNLEVEHPTKDKIMTFAAPVNSRMLEVMEILGFSY